VTHVEHAALASPEPALVDRLWLSAHAKAVAGASGTLTFRQP
jgi:hypothetical protein